MAQSFIRKPEWQPGEPLYYDDTYHQHGYQPARDIETHPAPSTSAGTWKPGDETDLCVARVIR